MALSINLEVYFYASDWSYSHDLRKNELDSEAYCLLKVTVIESTLSALKVCPFHKPNILSPQESSSIER